MYRDLWPKEIPDAVRRTAWAVARRWARSCPALADDIFQESRLACWLAYRTYKSGPFPLLDFIRVRVTFACRRVIGESRYYRFTDHRYRRARRDECQRYKEIENAQADETDPPFLPEVWAGLTDTQATILQLRVINGYSYGDIAAVTGRSKAAVAQCYSVAIRKARAIMEGSGGRQRHAKTM